MDADGEALAPAGGRWRYLNRRHMHLQRIPLQIKPPLRRRLISLRILINYQHVLTIRVLLPLPQTVIPDRENLTPRRLTPAPMARLQLRGCLILHHLLFGHVEDDVLVAGFGQATRSAIAAFGGAAPCVDGAAVAWFGELGRAGGFRRQPS